jgi:hypothetical protein
MKFLIVLRDKKLKRKSTRAFDLSCKPIHSKEKQHSGFNNGPFAEPRKRKTILLATNKEKER